MKHVAFVTYELHPVNPGGAGVLIAGAVRALARAGFRCTVVCDFPMWEVEKAQQLLAGENLSPGSVEAISVTALLGDRGVRELERSPYLTKTGAFARALRELHRSDPLDLIEFPEYAGVAFGTLRDRFRQGSLAIVPIVIRVHGGLEFIDQAEKVRDIDGDRLQMYRMERLALKMADYILGPSQSICQHYREAYDLPPASMIVSPPPVHNLTWGLRVDNRFTDPGHFLFYGKLQEVKGCDLFTEAAVSLIGEQRRRNWRFTFVGSDTPCVAHGRPTSRCIKSLIPDGSSHAFEFIPAIDRSQLPELARRPIAAVVPSRFETFCLAAHELRALGLPLIVSDIPAFRDYFSEATGCLTFDRTALGLRNTMLRMRDEPHLAETLASRPPPAYLPFITAYQNILQSGRPAFLSNTVQHILSQQLSAFG